MPVARVSVAIPTYNRLRFLKPCLDSIRAQTLTDIELYIFDDASTEPIEEQARALFGDKLTFIPAPSNMGAARNIDRALQYPYTTPYVIIFHDDDVMHPTLLQREVALLDAHPDAAFAATRISFCKSEGPLTEFARSAEEAPKNELIADSAALVRLFLRGEALGFSSVLYRTSLLGPHTSLDFATYGPLDDRPFLLALTKRHTAVYIQNQLVNYRVHAAQDSQTNNEIKKIDFQYALFNSYKTTLPQPLSLRDTYLFFAHTTNALLDTYSRSSVRLLDFITTILRLRHAGFIKLVCINHVGIRAIATVVARSFSRN